jgi:hypothetical protein
LEPELRESHRSAAVGNGDERGGSRIPRKPAPRREMLARTVWRSPLHARQIASLLEQAGIAPDRPLSADDIRGLPLTGQIWDEV